MHGNNVRAWFNERLDATHTVPPRAPALPPAAAARAPAGKALTPSHVCDVGTGRPLALPSVGVRTPFSRISYLRILLSLRASAFSCEVVAVFTTSPCPVKIVLRILMFPVWRPSPASWKVSLSLHFVTLTTLLIAWALYCQFARARS